MPLATNSLIYSPSCSPNPHETQHADTPTKQRGARQKLLTLIGLLILILGSIGWPQQAFAQSDDVLDSYAAQIEVKADGIVHIKETIVLHFGSNSGRHGLSRGLLTREEDPDKPGYDQVYKVTGLHISSPDASAAFTTKESAVPKHPRQRNLMIRVGDKNQKIYATTATYILEYDVAGLLRTAQGIEQLYWDALTDLTPTTHNVHIEVSAPGGAQQAACYSGSAHTNVSCTSSTIRGQKAVFEQTTKQAEDIMSIGVALSPGAVSNVQPIWEPAAKGGMSLALPFGLAAFAITAGLGTLLLVRSVKKRADERFLGIPPGTVPIDPQTAHIGHAKKNETIPVRFEPPQLPVALGGLVVDGQVETREMTATLIDLAVRGAIQLRSESGKHGSNQLYGRLVDGTRVTTQYEQNLIAELFGAARPGEEVNLSEPGSMADANSQLSAEVADLAKQQALMKRVNRWGLKPSSAAIIIALIVIGFGIGLAWFHGKAESQINPVGPAFIVALATCATVAIIIAVIGSVFTRRGTRSALGRAYTDQVQGFQEYLATAEAGQLRFEEGQDIFSQYLPWAIAFGLADRWARLCEQLVATGRLAPTVPYWYYGDPYGFRYGYFASSVTSAVHSGVTTPSSSGGSGWGSGGSAFSGGFSGGGSGGGSIGSW